MPSTKAYICLEHHFLALVRLLFSCSGAVAFPHSTRLEQLDPRRATRRKSDFNVTCIPRWRPSTTTALVPDMASLAMSNETLRAPNLTPPNMAYQGPHHTTAQPPRQSPLARPNLSNTQQPPSSRTPTSNTRDTSAAARVMKASPQKPSPATPRPDRPR